MSPAEPVQPPTASLPAPETRALDAVLAGVASAFASLGLPCVGLRYFNVFGPRQDPASEYAAVIPRFIRLLRAGSSPGPT